MGADIKRLKNRIRSVSSTMHITKAMELVASSKMKKANANLDAGRPYAKAVADVFGRLAGCKSVFTGAREEKKVLCVLIAGDRGLAGGYNNDVFKLLGEFASGKDVTLIPIGKRACDHVAKRGYETRGIFRSVENFRLEDGVTLGKTIAAAFASGEFDAVYTLYTKHISILTREPTAEKILPIESDGESKTPSNILFEPSMEAVLDASVPEYVSGRIYGQVCESFSAELAARRTAMDSATKNAGEIIDDLSLKYNRARQGAITQEITEIIGGSEAQ